MHGVSRQNIQGWDSLHPKQQRLYELLLDGDQGLTLDAMRDDLGVNSINTVVHHLKQLEKKGYIRRYGDNGRIEVLPAPVRDIVYLNLYGTVRCGPNGVFTDANVIDRIPFPAKRVQVNADSFLVEAQGDSMEPMIQNKDLVLVDRTPVGNGNIAVVLYQNGAVLKKLIKERGRVILQSLNSKYEPIVAEPSDIVPIGIVRGVIRKFPEDNLKKKNR